MSELFNERLSDVLDSSIEEVTKFLEQHLPPIFTVCNYKANKTDSWKTGVFIVGRHNTDPDDEKFYVYFLKDDGVVEEYTLWSEPDDAYEAPFFCDMDDNIKEIKQCDSLLEAITVLNMLKGESNE